MKSIIKLYPKRLVIFGIIAVVAIAALLPLFSGSDEAVAEAAPQRLGAYEVTVNDLMAYQQVRYGQGLRGQYGLHIAGAELLPYVNKTPNPAAPLVNNYAAATTAPAVVDPVPFAPQTLGLTFTSFTLDELGAATGGGLVPPDTMGVIGPTEWVTSVNGWNRSHDKATGAVGALDVWDETFWCPNGTPGTPPCVFTPLGGVVDSVGISDPRVRYDRHTQRWFWIIIDIPFTAAGGVADIGNRLLLAYSDGPTISGGTVITLNYFQHDAVAEDQAGFDDDCFFDYPSLGVDANALITGGNMFCPSFQGSSAWVINKAGLLGAGGGDVSASVFAFRGTNSAATGFAGPHTVQGVDNYDPAETSSYFVGPDNAAWGLINICEVPNSGGGFPLSYDCAAVTVPATLGPLNVPSLGGATLDAIDDRLMAAHMRDGSLWTSHNIGVDSAGVSSGVDRTATAWYEFAVASTGAGTAPTVSLTQSGRVWDPATSASGYWMGTIMVSGQGHAALGFTHGDATMFPAASTVGRLVTDPLGTTQGVPVDYQPGLAAYSGPNRWGDYSMTSVDPCNDMTMWTAQEFSDVNTVFILDWAIGVAELIAPPPAAPAGPAQIVPSGSASELVTITGAAWYDTVSPEANLDPCNIDLQVTLSDPNIVVNGITWLDAATIQLDLDTTAAAAGSNPLVTIINPDGQQAAADCIINIDQLATACAIPTDTPVPDPGPGPGPGPGITDPGLSKIGVLEPGQLGLPGEQITWVITVTNPTGAALTNIVVSDTFQPELQIDSVTTTLGSAGVSGQTVTVLIPFLSPGESVTINVVTTVLSNPAVPYFENIVSLTADGGRFVQTSARVPTAGQLPDTGYPPADPIYDDGTEAQIEYEESVD